jgi:CDP-diacylglycerol--glycerol-3-phosphate 3-phosphatidyltransferase
MNWANRITLSRLALTVFFVVALNSSWQYARTTALIIFLIAGLTDFIDGEIARRYGVVTNFGKLMDPLVDKIMMAAAFISLVPLKAVPAWAATTVVARDFLITGLRMMASAKGRILPAERLGKQKTSWQIITIIFFLALLSMAELRYVNENSTWWVSAWTEAGPVLVWITVALTIYSEPSGILTCSHVSRNLLVCSLLRHILLSQHIIVRTIYNILFAEAQSVEKRFDHNMLSNSEL